MRASQHRHAFTSPNQSDGVRKVGAGSSLPLDALSTRTRAKAFTFGPEREPTKGKKRGAVLPRRHGCLAWENDICLVCDATCWHACACRCHNQPFHEAAMESLPLGDRGGEQGSGSGGSSGSGDDRAGNHREFLTLNHGDSKRGRSVCSGDGGIAGNSSGEEGDQEPLEVVTLNGAIVRESLAFSVLAGGGGSGGDDDGGGGARHCSRFDGSAGGGGAAASRGNRTATTGATATAWQGDDDPVVLCKSCWSRCWYGCCCHCHHLCVVTDGPAETAPGAIAVGNGTASLGDSVADDEVLSAGAATAAAAAAAAAIACKSTAAITIGPSGPLRRAPAAVFPTSSRGLLTDAASRANAPPTPLAPSQVPERARTADAAQKRVRGGYIAPSPSGGARPAAVHPAAAAAAAAAAVAAAAVTANSGAGTNGTAIANRPQRSSFHRARTVTTFIALSHQTKPRQRRQQRRQHRSRSSAPATTAFAAFASVGVASQSGHVAAARTAATAAHTAATPRSVWGTTERAAERMALRRAASRQLGPGCYDVAATTVAAARGSGGGSGGGTLFLPERRNQSRLAPYQEAAEKAAAAEVCRQGESPQRRRTQGKRRHGERKGGSLSCSNNSGSRSCSSNSGSGRSSNRSSSIGRARRHRRHSRCCSDGMESRSSASRCREERNWKERACRIDEDSGHKWYGSRECCGGYYASDFCSSGNSGISDGHSHRRCSRRRHISNNRRRRSRSRRHHRRNRNSLHGRREQCNSNHHGSSPTLSISSYNAYRSSDSAYDARRAPRSRRGRRGNGNTGDSDDHDRSATLDRRQRHGGGSGSTVGDDAWRRVRPRTRLAILTKPVSVLDGALNWRHRLARRRLRSDASRGGGGDGGNGRSSAAAAAAASAVAALE
ncbi:unnamed protein product, partial [Phaeothamnion confervicola]